MSIKHKCLPTRQTLNYSGIMWRVKDHWPHQSAKSKPYAIFLGPLSKHFLLCGPCTGWAVGVLSWIKGLWNARQSTVWAPRVFRAEMVFCYKTVSLYFTPVDQNYPPHSFHQQTRWINLKEDVFWLHWDQVRPSTFFFWLNLNIFIMLSHLIITWHVTEKSESLWLQNFNF